MQGAPSDFLAETSGVPCVVRKALMVTVEVGRGRGRSCLRRVSVGWRGVVVSVMSGWDVGSVGFAHSRRVAGAEDPVRPRWSRAAGRYERSKLATSQRNPTD